MFSDILQATFLKLKLKIMDVTFLPGNLLHKAQSGAVRGLSSSGLIHTCRFLAMGVLNSSIGQSIRRRWFLLLARIQRRKEGRVTEKGRRRTGRRERGRGERLSQKERELVGHQERPHPHHG